MTSNHSDFVSSLTPQADIPIIISHPGSLQSEHTEPHFTTYLHFLPYGIQPNQIPPIIPPRIARYVFNPHEINFRLTDREEDDIESYNYNRVVMLLDRNDISSVIESLAYGPAAELHSDAKITVLYRHIYDNFVRVDLETPTNRP